MMDVDDSPSLAKTSANAAAGRVESTDDSKPLVESMDDLLPESEEGSLDKKRKRRLSDDKKVPQKNLKECPTASVSVPADEGDSDEDEVSNADYVSDYDADKISVPISLTSKDEAAQQDTVPSRKTHHQKSQTKLTIIPENQLPPKPEFEPFQNLGAKRINKFDHDSLCDAIKDEKDLSKYFEIFKKAEWVDLDTLDSYRCKSSTDELRERLNTKLKTNWNATDVELIVNFIKKSTSPDVNDIIQELMSDDRYADLILNYVNFRKYVIPKSHPLSRMGSRQRDTEIPTLDDANPNGEGDSNKARPYLPLLDLPLKRNGKNKVTEYIRERAVTTAKSDVNDYNCFVLYGVSGCGKTSSIFRYLALNYGIYFEASLPGDMGNQLSPDIISFTDKVDKITGDDIEKRTEHLIKCLLLGRVLLLRYVYLQKVVNMLSKNYSVHQQKLKHAWLHFQLRLNEVRTTNGADQLIVVLFNKLCECDESAVEAALKESVNYIANMGKEKIAVPVFIDEAQVLTKASVRKFEDSGKNPNTRALFSKVFRVMNSLPSPSKNIKIATFVSGTAITLTHEINLIRSAVGKPEAELPEYLIFKDFERMLTRPRMEAYVGKFINFTKLGSRSVPDRKVVEEVYTIFKGRPRFLAYFIATCLRSEETDAKSLLKNSIDRAKAKLIGKKGEKDNKISIRCALEKGLPLDNNESRRPAEIRRGERVSSVVEMLKKLVLSFLFFGEEGFTHHWEENSDAAELIDEGICYLKFDDEMNSNKPVRYGVQELLVVEAIEGFIRDEYDQTFYLSNKIHELVEISASGQFASSSAKGFFLERLATKWLQNFFTDENLIKAVCSSMPYEHLKDFRLKLTHGGVDERNGVVSFDGKAVSSVRNPKPSPHYELWRKECLKTAKPPSKNGYGYPYLHRFLLEPFSDFLLPEQNAGPDIVFLLDKRTMSQTGSDPKLGNEARDSSEDNDTSEQKLCLVQCKWTGEKSVRKDECDHGYQTTWWEKLYSGKNFMSRHEFSMTMATEKYRANEIGTVRVLICLPDFAQGFRKQHPVDIEVNGNDISFFINLKNMVQFGASEKDKALWTELVQ
ncbi:uncharacterized protein LOC135501549 [Lineus longissimus]|uniref:uncharacterized protein LOC135501549 n=1 Tax=Lineus longissimus TaxID=88925 RepID=UPI002B4EAA78